MNSKIYVNSRECWRALFECLLHASFTSLNRVHPKRSELSVQYRTHRVNMLECCHQDTKEAMLCIDNKYGLINFTNCYRINHDFSYLSTKTSYVTGNILNRGVVRLPILHTMTRDAVSSFDIGI